MLPPHPKRLASPRYYVAEIRKDAHSDDPKTPAPLKRTASVREGQEDCHNAAAANLPAMKDSPKTIRRNLLPLGRRSRLRRAPVWTRSTPEHKRDPRLVHLAAESLQARTQSGPVASGSARDDLSRRALPSGVHSAVRWGSSGSR